MKFVQTVITAFASAMLLSGCMTDAPVHKRSSDPRIEMTNSHNTKIELISSRYQINDEGLLTVNASAVLNRTEPLRWFFYGDSRVNVWYHFDWIDAKGNVFPRSQREILALPGNIVDFHGVAPSEKFISFRLVISLEEATVKENAAATPAAKPAAKPVAKKAAKPAAKPVAKKAAKPAVKSAKQPKLTEPFN